MRFMQISLLNEKPVKNITLLKPVLLEWCFMVFCWQLKSPSFEHFGHKIKFQNLFKKGQDD